MADTHAISINGTAVGFYRGKQSNLEALSNYKDGAFYITTDTNKMYYAQSDSALVHLNKFINVVNSTEDLPNAEAHLGEFYYISTKNILCYSTQIDDNGAVRYDWIQINYIAEAEDTKVKSLDIVNNGVNEDKDAINFNTTLVQKSTLGQETTITDDFSITKDQINALVDHPKTTMSVDANGTVALGGEGASDTNNSFTLKGSGGVSIISSAGNVTIEGTEYSLTNINANKAPTSTLILKDGNSGEVGTVALTSGTDIVLTPSSGQIEISHKGYETGNKSNADISSGQIGNGGTITMVKGVQVENGHIIDVLTENIQLPLIDGNDPISTIGAANDGTITVRTLGGQETKSSADLYYTIDDVNYFNQADLSNAIKNLITTNLASITNVMTFKGGISSSNPLPAEGVSIGDTYIITEESIYVGTKIASVGDLVIAYSSDNTENEEGFIDEGKLLWVIVHGTDLNDNTTYQLIANNNIIKLKGSNGSESSIKVEGDAIITLSAVATDEDGTTSQVLKGSHASIDLHTESALSETLSFGGSFTTTVGVKGDGYGHITGVQPKTFTLPIVPDQTNNHLLKYENDYTALKNSDGGVMGRVKIESGTDMAVNVTNTSDVYDTINYTINHAETDREDTSSETATLLNNDVNFTVIKEVVSNAQGHITGITTQEYKAVDTTYSFGTTMTEESSNRVSVKHTLLDSNGGKSESTTVIASMADNLTLSKNAGNQVIQLNLVWGTF